MIADNPIADLLSAPLGPDWTVERLADDLLAAIAERGPGDGREFTLDAEGLADRQSRRIFRPLPARLAARSAAEGGIPTNLYGGRILFERPGPDGPVRLVGESESTPGAVRIVLRRIVPAVADSPAR